VTITKNASGLEKLVAEAIRAGAEELDIEYKNGYDEVCMMHGPVGVGIARVRSSSSEGIALREELFGVAKKRRRLFIAGQAWDLRCRVRDSFGEAAFRVEIRRAKSPVAVKPRVNAGLEKRARRRTRQGR
jgi:hypothetical protein